MSAAINELRKVAKQIVADKKEYWRLPKNVVHSDLHEVRNLFDTMCSSLLHNDDFRPDVMETVIRSLQNIMKSAKKFDVGDTLPKNF